MSNRPRVWGTSTAATSAVLVLAGLLAASGTAAAQNAEAELLFRDGDKLMTEGKLAEACAAFEGSNRIEPRAGTLIRLGDCRERNGQLASAWSAFSDAAARAKDPKKRELGIARSAAIEPRISQLTIAVAGDSQVAGLAVTRNGTPVDPALWNRPIPVDGGTYTIVGRAPGHEDWTTEITVPVEHGRTTVDVPALTAVAAPPLDPGAPSDDAVPLAPAPTGMPLRRKVALGVAGGGVVVLVGAVIAGNQAKGLEHDAFRLCPTRECTDHAQANALLDRARSRATLANVGYGVGAAALVGGVALWMLGGRQAAEGGVALTPIALPDGGGAVVRGRF